MPQEADEAAPAAPRPKRGGWEGIDSVTRWLLIGSALAIIAALALTAAILYFGSASSTAPRTAIERDVMVSRVKVQQNPKDKQAWAEYASASTRAGRYDEAEAAIKSLSQITSEGTVLLLKGDLAYAKGDVSGARGAYEKAVEQSKKDYEARLKSASDKGVASSTVTKNETGLLAYLYLGRLDADANDFENAIKDFQEALKIDPNAADVLTALGDAQVKAGKRKDGVASYRKALAFVPDYAPAVEGLKAAEGGR